MSNVKPRTKAAMSEIKAIADRHLREFVDLMVFYAKSLSPYDTGNNRSSIAWQFDSGLGVFIVFTESGYGGWLEIGTSIMAARPYLRPAFEKAKAQLKRLG